MYVSGWFGWTGLRFSQGFTEMGWGVLSLEGLLWFYSFAVCFSLGERTPLEIDSASKPMALETLPAPSSCSSVCFMSSVLFDDNLDWAALASLNKLSLSDFFFWLFLCEYRLCYPAVIGFFCPR